MAMSEFALAPGEVVRGTVTRVAQYGIHLVHRGHEIVVLIPELSWASTVDPRATIRIGEEFDVLILRVDPAGAITGSLRALHPECDPWLHPEQFAAGTVFRGRIVTAKGEYRWVLHPSGIEGELVVPGSGRELNVGDEIEVVITKCDPTLRTFSVRLR